MTTIPPTLAPTLPAANVAAGGPVVILQQPPAQILQLPPGATIETVVLSVQQQQQTPPPQPQDQVRVQSQPLSAPQPSPQTQAPPPQTSPPAPPIADIPQPRTPPRAPEAPAPEPRTAVTLRTPAGDVTVHTTIPLDSGAKVALEVVRSSASQVTARVVAIDGQPTQQAAAQQNAQNTRAAAAQAVSIPLPDRPLPNPTQTAPLQTGQAWTASGPAPLTTVEPLSAYVLKGPVAANVQPVLQTPGGPLNFSQVFQPGADLGIRVVNFQAAATSSSVNIAANNIPAPGAPITPQVAAAVVGHVGAPALAAQSQQGVQTPAAQAGAGHGNAAAPNAIGAWLKPSTASASTTVLASQATATPSASAGATLKAPPPGTMPVAPQLTPGRTIPGALVSTPIQAAETQGLKLSNTQGLGAFTPTPPKGVETAPVLVRLTGQVSAVAPGGAVVVQTPAGEIQLNVRANLPVGSTVTLDVITAQAPHTPDAATGGIKLAGPTPAPSGLPLSTPAMGWGSLSEAVQLLQRTDPQAAAQLTAAIPDGGARTAVAAMAFVQAMRSGDPRQWPGDTALRGLERAGPRGAQLAAQISGDIREMARAADTPGEWRTLPMPWNADGRIERIALITRREDAGDEEAEKKKSGKGKGTRFLINLELSRLGEMQLDGMFVKSTRAFDMMIRTKTALPDDMRRDLTGLFAHSNAAMGLKGALTFQVVKKFPDPTGASTSDRGGLWA